ncbi:DUF4956 domain-containing protein [Feifania hominis]|uniref:DUF4956 domain-containing protein n=1 Tax=Feifania hominis TaxID=2763660 RepID=A0A926DD62_9FIRM|nr:DUF4956 domain-containing protein [Feifania hominis]MBC8536026.1 DUF4956 domain-containing protein [Feifania hominis]
MFASVLTTGGLTVVSALLCTGASILLGLVVALIYLYGRAGGSRGLAVTLVVLPALVQCVIMMASGNLGTSVAVLGTFSLVRFRSAPGGAREIACVFFAMAVGLATGMGYLGFAAVMTAAVGAVLVLLNAVSFAQPHSDERELRVTIPEQLDYEGVFDDIFEQYMTRAELERVKTTNLGSMFELTYHIRLRHGASVKQMMDEIRCRNGNLTVCCAKIRPSGEEL